MYARLVRFAFAPGNQDLAQALSDELEPLIREQPGCHSVTVFGDHADGQYGIFVLWDSEANAEAASQIVRPRLQEHLAGNVQGPPEMKLFAVISD